MNLKILIFHVYHFNMDISLITALFSLKTCICIAGICMEGSVSQNFDLVFVLWYVEEGILKKIQTFTKVTRFLP